MGEFSDQLLNADPVPAKKATSYADQLLSAELPSQNIQDSEGAGFATSAVAGLVTDPATRLDIFAKRMFPNDPEARGRFGIVDGREVFLNDQGQLQEIQGGFADFMGDVASSAPEMIAGAIGTGATGNPVTGSVVGGIGGNAVKRIFSAFAFDEPQTASGNLAGMAKEGAFSFGGAAVAKGVTSLANRGVKREAARLTEAARSQAADTIARVRDVTGIELDLAQVTNLPFLKAMKKWAAKFPSEASEVLQANADLQAGQAEQAITRIVRALSTEASPDVTGLAAINAAKASIEAARISVAEVTSPLYKKALIEGAEVNTQSVVDMVDSLIPSAKGSGLKRLKEVRSLLMRDPADKTIETGVDTTLQGTHAAKLELDRIIDDVASGKMSADAVTTRRLMGIKEKLLGEMDAASPLYRVARQEHERLTGELVDPLKDSVVGVLARIPEQRAASAAAKIFSGQSVSANSVKQAKKAVISGGGEEAWDGIVAQWLTKNLDNALKELQTGETVNMAGKFRQMVFGRPSQKLGLQIALSHRPGVARQFDSVMDAFEMLARTPISGSDTAFNQLVSQEMSKGVGNTVKVVLQPRQSVLDALIDTSQERNAKKIVDALLDPQKAAQLSQLTKLPPTKERAVQIISLLSIGRGLEQGADSLSFEEGAAPQRIAQ